MFGQAWYSVKNRTQVTQFSGYELNSLSSTTLTNLADLTLFSVYQMVEIIPCNFLTNQPSLTCIRMVNVIVKQSTITNLCSTLPKLQYFGLFNTTMYKTTLESDSESGSESGQQLCTTFANYMNHMISAVSQSTSDKQWYVYFFHPSDVAFDSNVVSEFMEQSLAVNNIPDKVMMFQFDMPDLAGRYVVLEQARARALFNLLVQDSETLITTSKARLEWVLVNVSKTLVVIVFLCQEKTHYCFLTAE